MSKLGPRNRTSQFGISVRIAASASFAFMVPTLVLAQISIPASQRPQGSVVGWGDYVIGGDISRDVVAVATTGYHALALKKDGSIVAWGEINPEVYKGNDFVGVSAGNYHTVALKKDGSVISFGCQYPYCVECNHSCWCVGVDPLPTPNTGFIQVVAGNYSDYGLRNDGAILYWYGSSPYGTTGVLAQNTGVVSIWGGGGGLLGLRADGSVWPDANVPPPNSGFIALAAGEGHYLGLKADGSIVGWGNNNFGQLNLPEPNSDFMAIAAGPYHSLGLKADGSVVSWGCHRVFCPCQETSCGCGNPPSPCSCQMEVAEPSNNTEFVSVSAGFMSGIGIKADGSVARWGYAPVNGPTPNSGIVAVFGRYVALRADGSLAAWGCLDNDEGECYVPAPNENFVDFTRGTGGASFGLKSDGTIVAWGCTASNESNCQIPEPNADFVDIEGSDDSVLGLKSDGSIVAWGDCPYGACNVPKPNADFVGVAAHAYKGYGLKSNGSIIQWGCLGLSPQSCGGVPTPESSYVAISAIGNSTVAVESNGRVVNFELESCVPTPNLGFIAATTNGWDEFSALKNDGSIRNSERYNCLGGQLPPPKNPSPNVGFVALGIQTAVQLRPGDFDGDGFVDSVDLIHFVARLAGPKATPQPERWRFLDLDDDNDVDLADFRLSQNSYTGSTL